MGEATGAGPLDRDVEAAVETGRLVRVGADEYLAAEVMQRLQQAATRVELLLAATVVRPAVYLERHPLPHQVLHRLERGTHVARVVLVEGAHLVVESRDEVEVAHEGAPEPVVHLRLQPVVRTAHRVPVAAEALVAQPP